MEAIRHWYSDRRSLRYLLLLQYQKQTAFENDFLVIRFCLFRHVSPGARTAATRLVVNTIV